jgi:hypothetical protein
MRLDKNMHSMYLKTNKVLKCFNLGLFVFVFLLFLYDVKVYASVDVNVTHEYPGETKTHIKRFETIDEASMYVDWMNSGVVRCDPSITSVSIDFNRDLLGQPLPN